MVTPEGEVMRGLEEFVGGGYSSINSFIASKFYQQAQENLHKLAEKWNSCGKSDRAKDILALSESLSELYDAADIQQSECRKE